MEKISLVTWNVNGIKPRLDLLKNLLNIYEFDLVFIQEIRTDDKIEINQNSYLNISNPYLTRKGHYGTSVLIRKDFVKNKGKYYITTSFRWSKSIKSARVIKIEFPEIKLVAVGMYAPNGGSVGTSAFSYKKYFFDKLVRTMRYYDKVGYKILLCGDFNIIERYSDDSQYRTPIEYEKTVFGAKIMLTYFKELTKILNRFYPPMTTNRYTWYDYRFNSIHHRDYLKYGYLTRGLTIDFIISNCTMIMYNHICKVRMHDKCSDHIPVIGEFYINK